MALNLAHAADDPIKLLIIMCYVCWEWWWLWWL